MKYNPAIHHRRSVRLKGYDYAKEGMYFITICTHKMAHLFGEVVNHEMVLSPFGEIAHRAWEKLPERWPHIELGEFQIMPNHLHGVLLIHRPYSMIMAVENGIIESDAGMEIVIPEAYMPDGATTYGATTHGATTRVAPTNNGNGDGCVGTGDPCGRPVVTHNLNDIPIQITPDLSTPPPDIPFSKIQWATRPYLGQIIGAYKSIVSTECLKYQKQYRQGVWLDKIWHRSFYDVIIRDARAFDNISRYIIYNAKNWREDKFND